MITECLIWPGHKGSGAIAIAGRVNMQSSPRAAGAYTITSEAQGRIEDGLDDSCKARLTTMLIDQRERGVEWPEVTLSLIDLALNEPPLPVDERADRLLRFITRQLETVATLVGVARDTYEAYAWSESTDWDEIAYLFKYMDQMGWVEGSPTFGRFSGEITVKGHNRIAEQRINIDSSQAFVAMWFDDSMTDAYADGVAPGIRDAGYDPLRIDRKEHINKIDSLVKSHGRGYWK